MARRWKRLAVMAFVLAGGMLAAADEAMGQAAAAPARPGGRTRVVMLGTGVPVPDPNRFGSAVVVLVDSTPYLFDMGAGVVRRWAAALQTGIGSSSQPALRTVFVTHLHSDHTVGYADLIFTTWTVETRPRRPLNVYGPKGLQSMTDHILAAYAEDVAIRTGPGGESEGDAPPVVRVHEVTPGVVYRDSLVTVTAFAVHHGTWPQAFGYRVQTPDKTIVLSGDAAPPSAIAEQCHGCDLLLHEGGSRLAAEARPYFHRFHTTVEEMAAVAKAAQPKLLVLYHQLPAGPDAERAYAALRSLYPGPFVVARDLDVYR